ncbi:MAG TPA: carboxypeptidase-like regulatory domain-containing protein [Bacteroidales bacterium]|nr:carboxypeptidase-like regulatory domain-containing protein [Bacteroidales bacterium]
MRLIRLLIILSCLHLTNQIPAQEYGMVKGRITDENELPVLGATITVTELVKGTITDQDGLFEIEIPANQTFTIEVSYIGYLKLSVPVKVAPGKDFYFERQLSLSTERIDEVYIERRYEKAGTLERINIKSIELLPSAMGGVESMLSSFGASLRSEFSSQYSVRGGNFDENLVYINDIEIYRPLLVRAGQQEGLSIVNSSLVSSLQFSAGGFDAQYGDKMSSVLDIKYKRPSGFGGSFTGSFVGASAHLEGATTNKRFTAIGGVRYKSNQYLLQNLQTKGDYKPSFLDFQTFLTYDVTKWLELSLLGNISQNLYKVIPETRETEFGTYQQTLSFTVFYDGQESDRFDTYLGAISLDIRPIKETSLKLIGTAFNTIEEVAYDIQGQYLINLLDNVAGSETFGDSVLNIGVGTYLQHARNYLQAKVYSLEHKGSYYSAGSNLKWGLKYQYETIDDKIREWEMLDSAGYSIPYSDSEVLLNSTTISKNLQHNSRITGYVQNTFLFQGNSAEYYLTTGIRTHYWSLGNQVVLSPRIGLTITPYWLRRISFHAATGYYYQPPFYKELRDPDGNLHKDMKAQKSIHYLLGGQYNFSLWERPFVFSTEMFYKHLWNLIPYKVDDVDIQYLPHYIARGYVTGIEFKINGEFVKDAESWASLSIMQTKEDIYKDYYLLPDKTVVWPGYYRRPTDQVINFGLFFQDYFPNNPDYKVHLNLSFASRIPYGTPDYSRPDLNVSMKPYRRVDIGLSKSLNNLNILSQYANVWLSFEIFNLFGLKNQASYQWIKTVKNSLNLDNTFAIPNYLTGRIFNVKVVGKF